MKNIKWAVLVIPETIKSAVTYLLVGKRKSSIESLYIITRKTNRIDFLWVKRSIGDNRYFSLSIFSVFLLTDYST